MEPCMRCHDPAPDGDLLCRPCAREISPRVRSGERRARVRRCEACEAPLTTPERRAKMVRCGLCVEPADASEVALVNRRLRDKHPSQWSNARRTKTFLAANPSLTASLAEDSKKIRYRCTKYRITAVEWLDMVAQQNGRCAICQGTPDSPDGLFIDHDHDTQLVRGLLCHPCNIALGFLRIDGQIALDRARAVLTYVESHLGIGQRAG